jgi:hypothetical protein
MPICRRRRLCIGICVQRSCMPFIRTTVSVEPRCEQKAPATNSCEWTMFVDKRRQVAVIYLSQFLGMKPD